MPNYIDVHPISGFIEWYAPVPEESGTCPFCGLRLAVIAEGVRKCLYDGYLVRSRSSLVEQGHYFINRSSLRGRIKRAYPQPEELPHEHEYNLMVGAGWTPEEAFQHSVADFSLTGDALDYFRSQIEEQKVEEDAREQGGQ